MKSRWMVSAVATSLFVSGCSSNDDQMAELELPTGTAYGDVAPVTVSETDDTLGTKLNELTPFAVIAATLSRYVGDPPVGAISDDDYRIESVTKDDGDELGFRVVYVLDGEEKEVHYSAESATPPNTFNYRVEDEDGRAQYFWLEGNRVDGQKFSRGVGSTIEAGEDDHWFWSYGYFGVQPETMPVGTASYSGAMRARAYDMNNPSSRTSSDYRGSVTMTVDLDGGTLEGRIEDLGLRLRDAEGNRLEWGDLPETTHFAIEEGRILDGRFVAAVTGMDTNADAAPNDTVQGFTGGALGTFYGPEAEEIGAVFNASSDAHGKVMVGNFGAGKR